MIYVKNSGNGKLGPNVDATYASIDDTCPRSCALRDAGCYAQQWRVNETQKRAKTGRGPRAAARAEARAIRASKSSNPVRLHVAGDARTNEAARILARACEGRRAWSYTHAWRVVRRESWGAVSTLASLENPRDVAHAASLGYAVAIVVAELPSDGKAFAPPGAPEGWKAIPCPAMTRDVDCASCRLCWHADGLAARNRGIAFAAHGGGAAKARRTLPVVS